MISSRVLIPISHPFRRSLAATASSTTNFAIVKVGGGVVDDTAQLSTLCTSLLNLRNNGYSLIVMHGAGPQLNDQLTAAGVKFDWHEGIRITSPEVLAVAQAVFLDANQRLSSALQKAGAKTRSITKGCLICEPLDLKLYQLVGDVKKVNHDPILSAANANEISVMTCLGETTSGQGMNINADIAAAQVAISLQATRAVYINTGGGLTDDAGKVIKEIRIPKDYDALINLPWVKHGTRLKLKQMKALVEQLPPGAVVAICAPQELGNTVQGGTVNGTVFHKSS